MCWCCEIYINKTLILFPRCSALRKHSASFKVIRFIRMTNNADVYCKPKCSKIQISRWKFVTRCLKIHTMEMCGLHMYSTPSKWFLEEASFTAVRAKSVGFQLLPALYAVWDLQPLFMADLLQVLWVVWMLFADCNFQTMELLYNFLIGFRDGFWLGHCVALALCLEPLRG